MTLITTILIFIGILSLLTMGGLVWFFLRAREDMWRQSQEVTRQVIEAQKQNQSFEFLQRDMNNLREQLTQSVAQSAQLLADSQKTVSERLDKAAEVVGNVQRSLGSLDQATKQVFMVGKDIAQLQEILRAPKLRGSLGELFLGDLLAQILPANSYSLQYAFKSGDIVDAIIKLGRLVPVDSKFPLENFKRLFEQQDPQEKTVARRKFMTDVKRHIDAIATKYLHPDEGTFDFALMYIPAENVYYETIIKDDASNPEESSLMAYAFGKRVVPVSPNSFYAYLHTISLGLRGLKIEENAKQIFENLSRLHSDFERFKEDFSLVGKHLGNTRTKFEDAERRLERFDDKLISMSGRTDDVLALPKEEPLLSLPPKS